MIEALSTALMGIVVVFGGLYVALRWIVLAGPPDPRDRSVESVDRVG